jgi:hypothetical protein
MSLRRLFPSRFAAIAAVVTLAAGAAVPIPAQQTMLLERADSLLIAGQVARAEALYYSLSRQATRDPAPRAALGSYLGSRGAFRVGATLLEEALVFGADTAAIGRARAPLLQAGDDWAALAQLPGAPLSSAARARATWLAANPPVVSGADSVTVAFERSSVSGLGRVRLVVGRDTLAADVDPTTDELVVGDYTRYAALVRVFADSTGGRVAVIERAAIGDLVLERVPARFDARLGPSRARLGLILLAKLAPTVDEGAELLTLRRDGRVSAATGRRRIAVVFGFPGLRIARPDRLVPIESPAGRAVLAQARWTLDIRRGELVLEVDER